MVKTSFYIAAEMGPLFLHALRDTKSAFIAMEESWFSYFGIEEGKVLKRGITVPLLSLKEITDFLFNDSCIAQLPEHYLHKTNRGRNILAPMLGQTSQPTLSAGFSAGGSIYSHSLC